MTDFRVLKENTFTFKGDKLYLMLVIDNASYGIEVVDHSKTFGRKMTSDRKEADNMFDVLSDRLAGFSSLVDATNFLEKTFSMKSKDKFRFAIVALNNVISQNNIVEMLGAKIKFKTKLQFNYSGKTKKKDALTVYIYFGKEKKPLGMLVGTTKADDLKFNFL